MSEYDDLLIHLGIGVFNIPYAASLIAKSLYFDGIIELEEANADDFEYSQFCPKLEKALEKYIEQYSNILLEAIEKKTLDTVFIRRKIDESIIPNETLISDDTLVKWLEERSIFLGEIYFEDHIDFEAELIEKMMDLISNERLRRENPEEYVALKQRLLDDPCYYLNKIKGLERELQEYKTPSKEKPFHKKEKQSLLKLFAGMAICNYGYDSIVSRETKASEISSDIMINSGISIDEDTVRKFLKKAVELVPVIEKV